MRKVELWGGVECTCRRVGNTYSDQLTRNGHNIRLSDLDAFSDLGLRRLRYPVLWEHVAPHSLERPQWAWADERLTRLRELNIDPIVGLVHHGSGPRYTALHQANFASGLARYACMVAERYPWVTYYTPVNEPLTTARFSGLYGLWYPHGLNDRMFVQILLNQVYATKLAMLAIRRVNPHAQLVQTEDLGKTHSTPALVEQAEFENHRRWLTFDLLSGTVTRQHPLWSYLHQHGVSTSQLQALCDEPLPPDIMGINYYVTSERFLDERLVRYPHAIAKGNGWQSYVDTEAVRVSDVQLLGVRTLLLEAWERYKRPLAITEAHLACTREEQMRWLQQTWEAANELCATGVDMRAMTVWSLLGAFDWNSLLTRDVGHYESGVFDVRSGHLRPTALYKMVQSLVRNGHYDHPLLQSPGWWKRDIRFTHP
jgi:beta-glucosidase/6-phospho-beta-glucosidase/beta-galactosidase